MFRLIKHTAQDLAGVSHYLATYTRRNAKHILFGGLLFALTIIPAFSKTESLEIHPGYTPQNSQTMSLLSSSFSIKVPEAAGGPLYAGDDTRTDVLASTIGVSQGKSYGNDYYEDTNGIRIYPVQKGDTLSEIAHEFDVSVNTIKWENNLTGNTLKIGQKLRILPVTGIRYTIKKGDNLAKIAKKYEAELKDILEYNNIDENKLKVGQKIIIPNGIKHERIQSKRKSSSRKTSTSSKRASRGYYVRPTSGRVTSKFGTRIHPITGRRTFHYGIDFGGVNGVSPIVAAASGKVISDRYCGRGYGICVEIQHDNGTKTRYAHNSRVLVKKGDYVKAGQQISVLGATGNVTGPHLHFEIIKSNGSRLNPNNLF